MYRKLLLMLSGTALLLSACTGKTENVTVGSVTTAYVEKTESTEATEATDPEYLEEEYFQGIVEKIDGSVVTIRNDEGLAAMFDISEADNDSEEELLEFCEAEVSYSGKLGKEAIKANAITVIMSLEQVAEDEDRDPVICGTFILADINELVIRDANGVEKTLDNNISRLITLGGVKEGTKVQVTYTGSLENLTADRDAVALKVVTEDALDTEEAAATYLEGTVSELKEDGFVLETAAFGVEFSCSKELLKGIEDGGKLRVYYENSLKYRIVDAVKVEVL